MKVAILSESPADQAAIRILIAGILGRDRQEISLVPYRYRTGGWPAAIGLLPGLLPYLHYRTDADALVVVVDSDDSPIHQQSHDETGRTDLTCRLCLIRSAVVQQRAMLETERLGREPIKIALGLAVPAIEAWYRCGLDPHVNEAVWGRKLQGERITYTRRSLKRDVYGTERPSIELETIRATEAANRLVNDLHSLELLFPNGFGAFAREVRGWETT